MAEGEKQEKDAPPVKSEPMDVGMTIVTGRKLVIDKETGQVRFEEPTPEKDPAKIEETGSTPPAAEAGAAPEEPAAAMPVEPTPPVQTVEPAASSPTASGSSAAAPVEPAPPVGPAAAEGPPPTAQPLPDLEKTLHAPPPPASEPVQSVTGAPVDAAKPNKRLSAETLFAFALPEPVLKKAKEDAKRNAEAQRVNVPTARTYQGGGAGKLVLLIVVVAALIGGGVWLLKTTGEQDPELAKKSEEKPVVEVVAGKDPASQPPEGKQATASSGELPPVKVSEVALPPEPVTAEQAGKLSVEQLAAVAAKSSNLTSLASVLKEASVRRNAALTSAVLPLASNPNYQIRAAVVRLFVDKQAWDGVPAERVTAMLLERVDDPDEIVRAFAAKALGVRGDASALPKLRARLDLEESDIVNKILKQTIADLSR